MAFKLIKSKYNKQEIKEFAEEHKHPTAFQELKEGEKIAFGIPKYEHTKGKVVSFKGRLMVIRKVEKEGITLEPLEVRNGNLIDNPLPKTIYVPDKEYHKIVKPHVVYTLP
jgi:hypothetical protein